jgi:hypothetical protein
MSDYRWISPADRLPTRDDVDEHGCVLVANIDESDVYRKGPDTAARQLVEDWTHWAPLPKVPKKRKVKIKPSRWGLADVNGELCPGIFHSREQALRVVEDCNLVTYVYPIELTGEFEVEEK